MPQLLPLINKNFYHFIHLQYIFLVILSILPYSNLSFYFILPKLKFLFLRFPSNISFTMLYITSMYINFLTWLYRKGRETGPRTPIRSTRRIPIDRITIGSSSPVHSGSMTDEKDMLSFATANIVKREFEPVGENKL